MPHISKRYPVAVAVLWLVRISRRVALHNSVQRGHLELQGARGRRCGTRPRCSHRLGLRNDLIRQPPLLWLFAFFGRGGPARRQPVSAACRHPDGEITAGADHCWRRTDVFVVAEARYGTLRYARRACPARGRGEVREEGRVGALAEAEGDGHFLFADGLVEEAYVSVDLRKMKSKMPRSFVRVTSMGWAKRRGEKKKLSTYRVVGRLREADFLLRAAHDLLHQPA